MNLWLDCPLSLRLLLLGLAGGVLGSLVNWAVYTLAYSPRAITPWTAADPKAPPRRWPDRLPIVGWFGLRREAKLHGSGFWARPCLVEFGLALFLPTLYYWVVVEKGLLPLLPGLIGATPVLLHSIYLSHVLLIGLMLAASLIDADEKIIPDSITVTGTLLGLALAALLPLSLLPTVPIERNPNKPQNVVQPLLITSPNAWPAALDGGAPHIESLLLGAGCYLLWCIGLLERPWRTRRGYLFALKICWARARRGLLTPRMLGLMSLGIVGITLVWNYGNFAAWRALLTALVGMAVGGFLIWCVRVLGKAVLGREAMGFGDVTLMAMLGAFLGWQSTLLIFFMAPLAGVVLGVGQWILKRENEIPYGPFLCLAALAVILGWAPLWGWAWPIFDLGWIVPGVMLVCLVLLGVLLGLWRWISIRFLGFEREA